MLPRSEEGFSLLEVVVALAVFSLGALATMNVLGEGSRSAGAQESRLIAGIIAENRLAEAMVQRRPPSLGAERGTERAMSRDWAWEMRVAPSPDPRVLRIDVSVRAGVSRQVLAELSSFRAAQ
jgi:general secretion pathway protein I